MKSFDERYRNLNPAQRQAVDTLEGPVLVVAGPGAGKTELLSIRIANILRTTDTLPSSILCLTFTDAAAKNMRERLFGLIGPDAYKVAIHTFHSFGTEVIGRHGEFFWNHASLQPADDVIVYEILQSIVEDLPERDPLRAYHPTFGFALLGSIKGDIDELKKGGITPEEFSIIIKSNTDFLEHANPIIVDFFSTKITKKTLERLPALLQGLMDIVTDPIPSHIGVKSMQETMVVELGAMLDAEKTTPLTAWKNTYLTKKADKTPILKGLLMAKKYASLAHVYEEYQRHLYEKGYFDFNDMLLQVVRAMEEYPELRFTLAEKYLYIMIDEFQDTNGVQMRLVRDIISETPGGNPNVLAVGDDDQAIYKFQGASLENILSFHTMFGDAQVITLVDNYRSTQGILDSASDVIAQSSERLVDRIPDLQKQLTSHSTSEEILETWEMEDELQESVWVAEEIIRIQRECPSDSIAVIARQHKHFSTLMGVLHARGVAFSYERKNNILEEPMVEELVQMIRFVTRMGDVSLPYDESLLPSLISLPFWGISPNTVWEVAMVARRERKSWLDCMSIYPDDRVREIASFLITLSQKTRVERLQEMLFICMGVTPVKTELSESYYSPWKEYYFPNIHDDEYLYLLGTLKVFVEAVSNYKKTETLYAQDVLDFVDLRKQFHIALSNTTPLQRKTAHLTLLTAHKSKGLEFDHVFVIHANTEEWIGRAPSSKLPLPSNVIVGPEKDNLDDKCRLLFVAMTRAKRHLSVSRYVQTLGGDSRSQIPFITSFSPKTVDIDGELQKTILENAIVQRRMVEMDNFEERLQEMLQNYSLSATHLQRFVNILDEGPARFLETSVLAFPREPSTSASYGTAIHAALQKMIISARMKKNIPTTAEVQDFFREALVRERLTQKDFDRLLERGNEVLAIYMKEKSASLDPEDRVEVRFSSEEVYVGGAHISGVIDRLHLNKETKEATVTDYKTGKAQVEWKGKSEFEKIKLLNFKIQLYFYKFLVEGSRTFGSEYTVTRGELEFVETREDKLYTLGIEFDPEEEKYFKKLIEVVYTKIRSLDFPDVSTYPQNIKGIEAFMDDLVEGAI